VHADSRSCTSFPHMQLAVSIYQNHLWELVFLAKLLEMLSQAGYELEVNWCFSVRKKRRNVRGRQANWERD
jgi:hypothetical protein